MGGGFNVQKTHRQDTCWANAPPRGGPTADATAQTLLKTLGLTRVACEVPLHSDDSEEHASFGNWN